MIRTTLDSRLVVTAMALISLMSGCAAEGVNQPPTTTSTTARDSQTLTPPPITRPLNASAYQNKPCELLTTEQVAARDLAHAPDIVDNRTDRADCYWKGKPAARTPTLRVSYYPGDRLARIYSREPLLRQLWDGFIPVTIVDQPAARTNLPSSPLSCAVAIGVAENQSVEVFANETENACDTAVAIAEVIVRNLGG